MKRALFIFGIIILISGVSKIFDIGYNDELEAEKHYQEMIQLHEDTNGEYGYPPYKGD